MLRSAQRPRLRSPSYGTDMQSGHLLQRFPRVSPRWNHHDETPSFHQIEPQQYQDDRVQKRESPAGYRTGARPITWKQRSTLWQARLWLGRENGGSISLGLYRSESEAHKIWLAVSKGIAARGMIDPLPLTAWECLIVLPGIREGILPRWVIRVGNRFTARARIAGVVYSVNKFKTPRAAFKSLWKKIKPLFPPRKPQPEEKPDNHPTLF